MTGFFLRVTPAMDVPAALRGAVVAIGNFDGVHLGHQAVLGRAMQIGREKGLPVVTLTFEPHPRNFFTGAPVFRLTPPSLRARLLQMLGLDAVVELTFDAALAATEATRFVSDILVDRLGAAQIVVGYDFHFGKDRVGTPDFLREEGRRRGFTVDVVDPRRLAGTDPEKGEAVSSSTIRKALAAGDLHRANALLGYRYGVEGRVQKGQQLGRKLGYPTANMALPPEHELAHGIYGVRYRRENGALHDGVASYGRRPTVTENGESLLETYLFDFSGDLYGETGMVSLFGFIRGEEKFDGLDALIAQMKCDERDARRDLAQARPLSELDRIMNFDGVKTVPDAALPRDEGAEERRSSEGRA